MFAVAITNLLIPYILMLCRTRVPEPGCQIRLAKSKKFQFPPKLNYNLLPTDQSMRLIATAHNRLNLTDTIWGSGGSEFKSLGFYSSGGLVYIGSG